MKTGAIIRIVIFSVLFLILLGLLIGVLCISPLVSNTPSGEQVTVQRSVEADEFSKLEIDWAAGSVKIMTGYSEDIIIKETKDTNNPYAMVTELDGNTLKISYAESISFHLGSLSGKDLIILVPSSWNCRALEIDGAALDINISGLTADYIELNGAATKLNFSGSFDELECSGAAAELNIKCTKSPKSVTVDGAACKVGLSLPKTCGFVVDTDGLAIDFNSSCDYTKNGNTYTYGNENCEIDVSGLGCKITVNPS